MDKSISFLVTVEWNEEMDKYHKRERDEESAEEHYTNSVKTALKDAYPRLYIDECGYESNYTVNKVNVKSKKVIEIFEGENE